MNYQKIQKVYFSTFDDLIKIFFGNDENTLSCFEIRKVFIIIFYYLKSFKNLLSSKFLIYSEALLK
jgi:hypothetical protein